ncbi:plasmid pRiA4b ORF-3 family protein [Bacillus massilinigeriensis]|uniref:plasmid pRiA4b ORF-3 family protein n=1 Tax=Bacillus massilionigeriensis TaxID=1805475 RepID=UPI00096B5343|nr:plasmid pRiA4b ORF-3 family protein [Bacillus massilionigeriensis]
MLIQCTKKLQDQLKIKPSAPPEENPLFSWHANLITFNRRKTVVLMNDQNRYAIVLFGLKAKDFAHFDDLILSAIQATFREEDFKDEVIEQFISYAPQITYAKTKDRSLVSKLNQICDFVYYLDDFLDSQSISQPALSVRASRFMSGDGKYSHQEMFKDLEKFSGRRIFDTEAIQIKVTLLMEQHHVYRRLIVPLRYTFKQLHEVLQVAFGWHDYHLHEFLIFDNESKLPEPMSINNSAHHPEGKKPILSIVCDEEALSFGDEIPMKLEKGIKLSEYLPKYRSLRYNYDFGDNWRHDIEAEDFIEDYEKIYPVCLEGEGTTPPEDVGGEFGYEEFLKIISDKNHPEHDQMVSWGVMQQYKDFNIVMVNMMLKGEFS